MTPRIGVLGFAMLFQIKICPLSITPYYEYRHDFDFLYVLAIKKSGEPKNKRLNLVIGAFVVDCRDELDPMTDGMLKMMGVFAEMEKNMISQRVKSGMANAISKGAVVGRPVTTIDNLPADFIRYYPKYKGKQINVSELARLCRISRQTTYKYINTYQKVADG
jgi:DNA invertase Pin-like site-specific DNA recombinase